MNSLIRKISITALTTLALSASVLAAEGTVDAGGTLRLREESNTQSAILANLQNGSTVDVSGITEDGWYQVRYDGKEGYVSGDYLIVSEDDHATLPVILDPVYGFVSAGPLNVRSAPGTDNSVVTILNQGTVVMVEESEETVDGWYKIETGFVSSDYVEIVNKAEAVELMAEANKAKSVASSGSLQQQIVDYAKSFQGYPYVYGGTTPSGFDCSGYVGYVYKNFGITLNRVSRDMYSNGTYVAKSDLQPGDVLFFSNNGSTINHVGLYIGDGLLIHASTPSTGVIISSLYSSYYVNTYYGARRMV